MRQDANRLEQMPDDMRLARKIARIGQDLLRLSLKRHALSLLAPLLHRRLDPTNFPPFIEHLVDMRVEHVCAAVNGAQAREALREFAEPVQGVDVGRFAVARHAVGVEADALDRGLGHAFCRDVFVGLVEGHGVADEVARRGFEAVFVVDFFHRALVEVET